MILYSVIGGLWAAVLSDAIQGVIILVMSVIIFPISIAYVGIGVIVLLLLGQGAVLAPALRASRVSPVEATRSV